MLPVYYSKLTLRQSIRSACMGRVTASRRDDMIARLHTNVVLRCVHQSIVNLSIFNVLTPPNVLPIFR